MRRLGRAAVILAALAPVPAAADDGAPLSAIDWLSDSVATLPATAPAPAPAPVLPPEAPVANSALVPPVSVTPLDLPSPDRVGLLPPGATGLPVTLWSGSLESDLVTLVQAERVDTLPAIQRFVVTLMLAEADPPAGADPEGRLFLARVDKLLDLGAIEPAAELLRVAVPETPALFQRYFDVALLSGAETAACSTMDRKPEVSPTLQARIFCLARSGNWSAAALTLNTAVALGDVSPADEALLSRFLDPELFEGEPALPAPERVSPLVFRLHEAIGEPLGTVALHRAFAHADLRDTRGWKAQLDAAERLARTSAIDDALLFDLYTVRRPAASGGVWDRASAFRDLDAALQSSDDDLPAALDAAWAAAGAARIEPAFARHFGPRIVASGLANDTVYRIGLLTPDYEAVAQDMAAQSEDHPVLAGVATGQLDGAIARGRTEAAVLAAFTTVEPDPMLLDMASNGRLGEALLRGIAALTTGLDQDLGAVSEALALFRAVGLEDLARRAALELLILDRPT